MSRTLPMLTALVLWLVPGLGLEALKARRAEVANPIIWADVPDPSVIRVGDTYYMSSTTMHMSPGLPIMKSRDLVNWQIVGYAYDTLGDNDALNLQNGKNAYGRGSWASGPRCSGTVAMDVSHMKEGDYAGLGLLQSRYGFVGVKAGDNAWKIVMVSAESGAAAEMQSVPLSQKEVFLKVDCDFMNRTDRAHFYYSLDGKQWTAIGKPLQMLYTLPHFMGYRFALFNFSTQTAYG